jgi:hypothetical protein
MASDDRIESYDGVDVGGTVIPDDVLNAAEEMAAGNLVAFNSSTYSVIDQGGTDPITAARDAIPNGGAVWLPPGGEAVQSTGAIGGFNRIHYYCPSEQDQFTIRFTDYANPGIHVDGAVADERYTTFENIEFHGDDRSQRSGTARTAIKFDTAVPFWNLRGTCDFVEWGDPVIHMDTGHPFESEWGKFYGRLYDGRFILMQDGGEPLKIRHITAGPENATDPSTGATAHTVHMDGPGGYLSVDTLDSRANKFCPRQLQLEISGADACDFGVVDWESSDTTATAVVNIQGQGKATIGKIRTVGADIDHAYRLGFDNASQILGPIQQNSMSYVSRISVEDDTAGLLAYQGPASDITNNSGTSPLSNEIECWGPNFTG